MHCPICEKRKLERFCPAKGEKICAPCCGKEREVSIDCAPGCGYLVAAHRYEDEHPRAQPAAEIPFADVRFPSDLVYENQPVVSGLGYTIAKFAAQQPELNDASALEALRAVAETYRTLGTGIYYEKPPAAPLPRALYAEMTAFLQDVKKRDAERAGFTTLKDSTLFHLLVFLLRLGSFRTNGRPRSRRFLEFLRGQFRDAPELAREEPRIIVP